MNPTLKSQLTELLGYCYGVEACLASRVIVRVVGGQNDPFGSRVLASTGSCRGNQAKVMSSAFPAPGSGSPLLFRNNKVAT